MFFENISFVTVFISAIASTVVGLIWYSPWVLGKMWMKEMGYTPESLAQKKQDMTRKHVLSFLSTLVTAYALAVVINSVFTAGIYDLTEIGLVLALGFVASIKFHDKLYVDGSWKLFFINTGYQVASIVLMSLIIGLFS